MTRSAGFLLTVSWACVQLCTLFVCTEFSAGQTGVDSGEVRLSIAPGGLRRYERGCWSVLAVSASNGGDEAAEATLSVFLEKDTRQQFTRQLWLPAHSNRKTWLPIHTPLGIASDQTILHASSLNIVSSADGVSLSRRSGEELIPESFLPLDPIERHFAMIGSRSLPGHPESDSSRDDAAYEAAVEVKMLYDGDRKIINLAEHLLAPYPDAYDALDQLLICSDRIAEDSGGVAALRNWIARGGHAWIMLDLVTVETVRTLIGNAISCGVVDRVELTDFTIETPAARAVGADPLESWSAEDPVEFVRVLTDFGDVYSSIDGWPAAFSIPFGNGRVFITTLAARGWRYQFDEFADRTDANRRTSGPTDALRNLASIFNTQPIGESVLSDDLKPVLSEQLGYRVPSRRVAALILGLNSAVIVAAGVWLARREKLEHVSWVVVTVTTISAIVLVAIGSANTSSIPATSSILRLANVDSDTHEVYSDALAAFYSPDTVPLPLEINLTGVAEPDVQDLIGVAKRVNWDDDGRTRWENVDVASGSVRFIRARESVVLDNPIRAQATFGHHGLEGRVTGIEQLGTLSDAIIAAPPAPNSDAQIDVRGSFRAGPNDVLAESEYVSGGMLSDEQQRRQTIYRQILAPTQQNAYPQRPTLLVWGDAFSLGLSSPDTFSQTGSTLYAVPLDIGRTLPKQPFLVPSTFIRVSTATSKHGASAVYNPRTGRWMKGVTQPTQSFFRFLLPREVVPCKVQRVEITLKVHAPSRTVELTGLRDGQQVVVESYENPSGVLTLTVDDPDLLSLDEAGGLHFGVDVSPTTHQREAKSIKDEPIREVYQTGVPNSSDKAFEHSTWQIDYLRLQASGETL
ncbi:MAG: hypothetical protein H6822_13220 [Planctomycetaceae bacterium]|nr:hypothetical protein [Planctomycetales bacterium]MCB9923139.1 hypothetical protein [Planctomycetaceae bacterium]